jgi:anti-sigma B factor antagonist
VEIEIEHAVVGDHDLLAPLGDLDLSSYGRLRDAIGTLIEDGRVHLVVDLSSTAFLDSTALGALIGGRRRAYAAGGSFAIICDNQALLRVFAVTKLDLVFTLFASRAEWEQARG